MSFLLGLGQVKASGTELFEYLQSLRVRREAVEDGLFLCSYLGSRLCYVYYYYIDLVVHLSESFLCEIQRHRLSVMKNDETDGLEGGDLKIASM